MRRLRLLAALGAAAAASPASACKCQPLTRAEVVARADGVFVGRAVSVREEKCVLYTTFRVERVVKGAFDREVTVTSRRSPAACGVRFAQGGSFTVAANHGDEGWRTSICLMMGLKR